MKYKTNKDAISKIARGLGSERGIKGLPKVFTELRSFMEEYPYNVPKREQIEFLLGRCTSRKALFTILQKIFGLHPSLPLYLKEELEPALNKLGLTYKSGVIEILTTKQEKSLKNRSARTIQRYAKSSSLITDALVRKGNKLAEAYFAIYLIENHLRLFIWKVAGKSNGKLRQLLNRKQREKVDARKEKGRRNKWLAIRKSSDLFYLDIEDLGAIIQRNWGKVFENYFPDEYWIKTKIEEIAEIRNRIAHNNSFITDTEKKALELYMDQIFNQIK